eukprot:4414791-Prorocentrum_lima.AAC.1
MEADVDIKKHREAQRKASTLASKRTTKVPSGLHPKDLRAWLPSTTGVFSFFESGPGRVRVFYNTPSGHRMSVSASIKLHGEVGAALHVLRWTWDRHFDLSGESCPRTWLASTTKH